MLFNLCFIGLPNGYNTVVKFEGTIPYSEERDCNGYSGTWSVQFLTSKGNHTFIVSKDLIYKRLRHPSISVLKQFHGFSSSLNSSLHHCFVYFQAKQSRNSFPISDKISSHLFDLIHWDVWVHINKNQCMGPLTFLL